MSKVLTRRPSEHPINIYKTHLQDVKKAMTSMSNDGLQYLARCLGVAIGDFK